MDDSEKNTSERDDEVFKDSFKNARNNIPQRGFATTVYREFPDCAGLKHHNLWHNGRDTGKRLIEYKDRFVATTGKTYEVLPNEKVIELVEEALMENRNWNLTPDKSHSEGKWHVQNGNVVMSKESRYQPTGTSMLARYRFPDSIDPTGDGRELHLGICIGNSIDLSRGFSAIPYHYRSGCMNSMYHVRAAVLHEEGTITWTKNGRVDWNDDDLVIGQDNVSKEIQHLGEAANEIKTRYRNVRHTKRLDKEFVIQQIADSINVVDTLGQRYKELAQLKVSKRTAEVIANSSLPLGVLDKLEGITMSPEKDKDGNKTGRNLAEVTKPKTNWEMYNQVTDLLSHGSLNFNSTLKHMGTLDSIFQVWQ